MPVHGNVRPVFLPANSMIAASSPDNSIHLHSSPADEIYLQLSSLECLPIKNITEARGILEVTRGYAPFLDQAHATFMPAKVLKEGSGHVYLTTATSRGMFDLMVMAPSKGMGCIHTITVAHQRELDQIYNLVRHGMNAGFFKA